MTPYSCPVCDQGVEAFQPIDPFFESQAAAHGFPWPFSALETLNCQAYSCPACGASDRDRLLAWALGVVEPLVSVAARGAGRIGPAVLDIAPAAALGRHLRDKAGTYRSADLMRQDVDDRIDLCDMAAYDSGRFDVVVCSHVLEHIPDDRRALGEIRRVLSRGGLAMLLVPLVRGVDETDEDSAVSDPAERWRRFGQDDHIRLYGRRSFLDRIWSAGLVPLALEPDQVTASLLGLAPSSVLYLAVRRD